MERCVGESSRCWGTCIIDDFDGRSSGTSGASSFRYLSERIARAIHAVGDVAGHRQLCSAMGGAWSIVQQLSHDAVKSTIRFHRQLGIRMWWSLLPLPRVRDASGLDARPGPSVSERHTAFRGLRDSHGLVSDRVGRYIKFGCHHDHDYDHDYPIDVCAGWCVRGGSNGTRWRQSFLCRWLDVHVVGFGLWFFLSLPRSSDERPLDRHRLGNEHLVLLRGRIECG